MATGSDLKEQGQERVLNNERKEWLASVMYMLDKWSVANPRFYIEDFREWYESLGGNPPHSPNVWGALTKRLKAAGYRKTDETRCARRKSAHARTIHQWARP